MREKYVNNICLQVFINSICIYFHHFIALENDMILLSIHILF